MTRSRRAGWLSAATGAVFLAAATVGAGPAAAATGEVLTVGGDSFGQRGNGDASGGFFPGLVSLTAASDVAGGREHVLALAAGAVYAWGSDAKGQVGDGGTYTNRTAPALVNTGPGTVTAVTTGHYHSMALRSDGTVAAWGWNSKGQTGPGGRTALKVPAPVTVSGLPTVSMIAAGRAHSIALGVDGSVWTWGDDTFGQLGDGVAGTGKYPTPQRVSLPAPIKFIAGGRDTTYAITTGGDLYAWGNSQYGQVGNGVVGTTGSGPRTVLTPTKVALDNVVQIESGADHAVALRADGTAYSWGRNKYGQLGYSGGTQATPKRVTALPAGVDEVYVGRDHTVALADGSTYLWGRNDAGQLGLDPSTVPQTSTPQRIDALADAVDAGGGQQYTVILR